MTTPTLPTAAPGTDTPPIVDAAGLIADIERYLSAQPGAATAHRLVTKTTAELVAEALTTLAPAPAAPAAAGAPVLAPPSRLLRMLPDWALSLPPLRAFHGAGRPIGAAEHLELTALVIERYGWARGSLRTPSGRRCILGAQAVLYRLGYGDEHTVHTAAGHLRDALAARGITQPYHQWNDTPGRTREEALHLIRDAAGRARVAGR